ncbi:MAG: DUF2207 family protein [Acidimicrobiales bacterium]
MIPQLVGVLAVSALVALAVSVYVVRTSTGRSTEVGEAVGLIENDNAPAVVAALVSDGHVGPAALDATVLDLARRGWIRHDETDRIFGLPDIPPDATLRPFERVVLGLLFPPGVGERTENEVVQDAELRPEEFAFVWSSFRAAVAAELSALGYTHPDGTLSAEGRRRARELSMLGASPSGGSLASRLLDA